MKFLFFPEESTHWSVMLLRGVLAALMIVGAATALNSNLREFTRSLFTKPYRKVLSTVSGDILGKGEYFKIIKIKTHEGLFIEVYGNDPTNNQRTMIDRFALPDKRDGYFHIKNRATNLAIDDIDGDRVPEILAPTYDERMVAHLNVYRYNFSTERFERVPPDFLSQFIEQPPEK